MSNLFSFWNVSRWEWPQQGRATSALAALSQRAGVSSPLLDCRSFAWHGTLFAPLGLPAAAVAQTEHAGRLCLAPQANSGYVNKNAQQHTQGMYYNRPQQQQEMPAQPFILSVLFSVVGGGIAAQVCTQKQTRSLSFSLSLTYTHAHTRARTLTVQFDIFQSV